MSLSADEQPGVVTFSVNDKKGSTVEGFGGAITDSVAHVFGQLEADLQEEVIEALWGPTGQKCGGLLRFLFLPHEPA